MHTPQQGPQNGAGNDAPETCPRQGIPHEGQGILCSQNYRNHSNHVATIFEFILEFCRSFDMCFFYFLFTTLTSNHLMSNRLEANVSNFLFFNGVFLKRFCAKIVY